MSKLAVGIFIFDDVEVLDFAGPFEVFSRTRTVAGAASRRTDESAPFHTFTVIQFTNPKGILRHKSPRFCSPAHAVTDFPPCNSLYDTTGFRSTPIFSISHSTTSPGFRYSDFGSSLNAATPETVPVERTSPAEYPIGE